MKTEEAIQKIAAILDENRELKETIYGLNTDRNWWRTSALGTEKERSHLAVELIECRNMINEKTTMIDKLKGGAWMLHNEDDRIDALRYGSITGIFNRVKELEAKLADTNRRFNHVVKFNEKLVHDTNELFAERDATIDGQNARIKELQKERDDLKTEFENAPHGKRFIIKELFAELNAIIEELKSKLIDKEQQLNEAHELLQDMTSHDWEQSNEITSMKISHGKERKTDRQTIEELEAKLANSERQFNELDSVLVRTFALLHVVNGCLRKRDKTIDELESKLRR